MIPLYSTKQIRHVDEFAINKLGIPGVVLMENASREIFQKISELVIIQDFPGLALFAVKEIMVVMVLRQHDIFLMQDMK